MGQINFTEDKFEVKDFIRVTSTITYEAGDVIDSSLVNEVLLRFWVKSNKIDRILNDTSTKKAPKKKEVNELVLEVQPKETVQAQTYNEEKPVKRRRGRPKKNSLH